MNFIFGKKNLYIIYFSIVITFLILISIFSYYVGFLTPDSRAYLSLAQSIAEGEWMSYKGEYFANWPIGYPLLISIIHKIGNLSSFLAASKILNLICILGSFYFVNRIFSNIYLSTLFVINPIILKIYEYTWSENLFIVSVLGLICQLQEIVENKSSFFKNILILFFLLLGCLSRYPFGPLAFFIWISFYFVYGKKRALSILPIFIASGVFFISYLIFNKHLTGYPTGMFRVEAHESFVYLLIYFLRAVIENSFLIIFNALLLYIFLKNTKKDITIKKLKLIFNFKNIFSLDKKIYLFLFLVSLSYLFLSFTLRVYTWYDKYDTRTIGFGLILIFSCFLVNFFKNIDINKKAIFGLISIFLFSFLFSFLYIHTKPSLKNILSVWNLINEKPFVSAEQIIKQDKVDVNFDVIFSPYGDSATNNPRPFYAGGWEYYGKNIKVENLRLAPAFNVETLDAFKKRLIKYKDQNCVIDFTNIKDKNHLNQKLNSNLAIDIKFFPFKIIYLDLYEEDVKKFISNIFVANSYLNCKEALNQIID